jgi:hypothetical protein
VTATCDLVNEFKSLFVLKESVFVNCFKVNISLRFSQTIILMGRKQARCSVYTHRHCVCETIFTAVLILILGNM